MNASATLVFELEKLHTNAYLINNSNQKLNVLFCLGGTFGMVFGLEVIDPLLDPPTKKLAFVSIFFSFAFALFLLNRKHKRKTFDSIPNCSWWEPMLLIFTGAYAIN